MKLMHFIKCSVFESFFKPFFTDFGVSWKPKPWIPYGKGSKNHAFARIRFFTVSASIREAFCSPKRAKDHVPAHFGGPG